MEKIKKKVLSTILIMCLLLTIMASAVMAEEALENGAELQTESTAVTDDIVFVEEAEEAVPVQAEPVQEAESEPSAVQEETQTDPVKEEKNEQTIPASDPAQETVKPAPAKSADAYAEYEEDAELDLASTETAAAVSYLDAPTLISTDYNSQGISITWGAVSGATEYYVYRALPGGSWTKIATVSSDCTSYTDTAMSSGVLYYYTVKAHNTPSDVNSSYNKYGIAGIFMAAPVLYVYPYINSIYLEWTAVQGATHYRIYRKTEGTGWEFVKTVSSSTYYYLDTAVPSGTEYTYMVRGYESTSKMHGTNSNNENCMWMPSPSKLTVKAVSGGISVSWPAVSGATGYRLYRKEYGGSYSLISVQSNRTFVDTTAKAGNLYVYCIKSYKATDTGSYVSYYKRTALLSYYCAPSGKLVTWIGDSYSVFGASVIKSYFPGVSITAQIGKAADYDYYNGSNPSGIAVLNSIVNNGNLRTYLVFALGTNLGVGSMQSIVSSVMAKAGQSKVIFVTSRTLSETRNSVNKQLKTAVAAYPNAIVADWAAVCKTSYFSSDGAHLNNYNLWVRTIYYAILNSAF